ncbi:DUF7144 family membrane protein [Cryptosporangium minutisporangium]|uniref:Membrane protein n=1 Tax=Cryptosporangium minutisporangium TaxID=113569 RepID=A0ABP6SY16_9ACTN
MSDTEAPAVAPTGPASHTQPRAEMTGWAGWVIFAGVLLILIGAFHACEGLVAIFDPGYYAVTENGLAIEIDYTGWGWVHLILSLLLIGAGAGLIAGQMWARVVGVVLASFGALVNLAFLAAYPIWSTMLIALDVLVIYAIVVHGRELKSRR